MIDLSDVRGPRTLRAFMTEHNIKQVDLAKAMNVSPQNVTYYVTKGWAPGRAVEKHLLNTLKELTAKKEPAS